MLLDIAIADAYGAGFEFAKPEVLARRPNDFTRYFRHNLDDNLPGMYTDDTQMSIGLARWLLTVGPSTLENTTARDIAAFFVETFQRDPRQAYSRRMFKFLQEHPDVDSFLAAIDASSTRSGAAMRSAILGVLPTRSDVVRIAALQAAITHNTPQGIATSVAVASAAWHVRRGVGIREAIDLAQSDARAWLDTPLDTMPPAPVSYHGVPCTQAAFYALLNHFDDPIKMLLEIISYGGDTDTVAAIAMGIRALHPGPAIAWPAWCYDTLENGPWGLDYLRQLDAGVLGAWPAADKEINDRATVGG